MLSAHEEKLFLGLPKSIRIQSMRGWGYRDGVAEPVKSVALDGSHTIWLLSMVVVLGGGKMWYVVPMSCWWREGMKPRHLEKLPWILMMRIWVFLGGVPLTLQCQVNEMLLENEVPGVQWHPVVPGFSYSCPSEFVTLNEEAGILEIKELAQVPFEICEKANFLHKRCLVHAPPTHIYTTHIHTTHQERCFLTFRVFREESWGLTMKNPSLQVYKP